MLLDKPCICLAKVLKNITLGGEGIKLTRVLGWYEWLIELLKQTN